VGQVFTHTVQLMKISRPDSKSTAELDPSAGVGPLGAGSVSKDPAGEAPLPDQVQLSGLSSYLASALNGSAAHVAQVTELTGTVSSGQYKVDAYAVSGSIIQHSIEFGGGLLSTQYVEQR
jgi:hypothetical protein